MTASLARTLAEIEANQDLNKYVDPITGKTLAEDLGFLMNFS